ncbi:Cytochrome c oxidase polypeptide III [Cupriavidus sp. U2]|uniref:cytochrome c oxidase subunit 3 family protein n=1 Tax=Cupriavidus sp. U2 TaxID=2920269 RepID=UPI0018929EAA|nr:cytochrome c oxidase subunit 3 family protein [Cupriavidus sp. U2]KAI3593178.1 Cytochrome c oxidase polypeptide III [Cupriavidus sp. U2]
MSTPPFPFDSGGQQRIAARLGIWIFLGTELMFFGPLFVGYQFVRFTDTAGLTLAARHTDLWLGTANTAVLMTSSLCMALAVAATEAGNRRGAVRLLWAVAALGATFLVIKGVEYAKDIASGFVPGNAAGTGGHAGQMFRLLYYAMTGLHAVHLCVGIALVLGFAMAIRAGRHASANLARLEIVGLYWHFVDVIWLFLFPILYLPGRSAT